MMIIIIAVVAVLAFIVALCFIYLDNIKAFFSKNKRTKQNNQVKHEPKSEAKPEDFIPLKNQYDDQTRDASLVALFADEDDDTSNTLNDNFLFESETKQKSNNVSKPKSFDELFTSRNIKSSTNKSKKSISAQIKELSPELKALLMDTTLKKRDDV